MTSDPGVTEIDRKYLLHAVDLSRKHMEAGNGGPFGAVIVRDGEILAEGWNEVTTLLDPTAHAEVGAIRRACIATGNFSLAGATLYSSCEPCPMCLAATYWARIGRLVYANTRFQAASVGFDDEFLYKEIPKEPARRRMPTLHLPMDEAEQVFDLWQAKADKIAY